MAQKETNNLGMCLTVNERRFAREFENHPGMSSSQNHSPVVQFCGYRRVRNASPNEGPRRTANSLRRTLDERRGGRRQNESLGGIPTSATWLVCALARVLPKTRVVCPGEETKHAAVLPTVISAVYGRRPSQIIAVVEIVYPFT